MELLCVALVLVAQWPLLDGRAHAHKDMLPFVLPHLAALQDELHAGRLRVWDLSIYCGYHALGAGQAGSLYAPNLLLLGAFPLLVAYALSTLLHQWLLVRGLLGLVVELGGSTRAGLLAAGATLLSGSVASHGWHHNVVVALGWTAVALWLVARAARLWDLTSLVLLAGVVGLASLQAHPQWLAYLAIAALLLAGAAAPRMRAPAAVARVVAAFAGGGVLAAGQLLPVWGYQQVHPRPHLGGDLAFLASHGLRPADVPASLLGGAVVDAASAEVLFVGSVVWTLALARTFHGRHDVMARAGIGLAAVGLFLAPGALNPVYHALVHVPPFSLFRYPTRILIVAQLGLCLLAAGGLDLVRRRQLSGRALGLSVVVIGAGLVAAWATRQATPVDPLLAAIAGAATVILTWRARTAAARRAGVTAILAVTLVELVLPYHALNVTAPHEELMTPPPLARVIAEAGGNRRTFEVAAHEDLSARENHRRLRRNGSARFGVEYFSGFESAVPVLQELKALRLQQAAADPGELARRAAALSVRWLVADTPLEHSALRLAGADAGVLLYEVLGARPLAYVVDETGVAPAELEVVSPSRLNARAALARPGRLVVAYANDPGWVARAAEEELELELAEDLFLSVALPPGRHDVELAFEDPHVETGLRMSAVAWAAWVLALAWLRRRERQDAVTARAARGSDRR